MSDVEALVDSVALLEQEVEKLPPLDFDVSAAQRALAATTADVADLQDLATKPLSLDIEAANVEALNVEDQDVTIRARVDVEDFVVPEDQEVQVKVNVEEFDVPVDEEVTVKVRADVEDFDIPDVPEDQTVKIKGEVSGFDVPPLPDDQTVRVRALIDADVEKLRDSIKGLEKELSGSFSLNVDGSGVENLLDRILVDAKKTEDALSAAALAASFDIAKRELQSFLSVQEKALAALKATGQDGTEGYEKLQSDIAKTRSELDKLNGVTVDDIAVGVDVPSDPLAALADDFEKTKRELQDLQSVQEAALAQLKKTGKEGTPEYEELRKKVIQTREELERFAEVEASIGGDSGDKGIKDLLKSFIAFEAAGKAGEYLSGLAQRIGENSNALLLLKARTGGSAAEIDRLTGSAQRLFAQGVGGSFAEAVDAIGKADQQLSQFLNPAEIEAFTKSAAAIGNAFDKPIDEVISKSRTFIANFDLSGEEAANLVSGVAQGAANGMDDVFDTLDEYSQLSKQVFGEGAQAAAEFTGILVRGVQAGARDTDKLADTIKETQIRLRAGDIGTALKDIDAPVKATIEGIVKAGEQGQISVGEVLQQSAQAIETAFDAGQINETVRSKLQIALSGTPAEDLGSDLYGRVFGAPIDTAAIAKQGQAARQALENALGPTNIVDKFKRTLEAGLADLGTAFQPAIAGAGTFLSTLGDLGPGINLLSGTFGSLNKALGPFIANLVGKVVPGLVAQGAATGVVTAATGAQTVATGVQTAATVTATGALRALFATMLANPIFLVVAGITALGTALYFLLSSGEDVGEALEGVNGELEKTQTVLDKTAELDKQQKKLLELADSYDTLAEKPARTAEEQAKLTATTNSLAAGVPAAVEASEQHAAALTKEGQALAKTRAETKINTDVVRSFAEATLKSNAAIRAGAAAQLAKETRDLVEATGDATEKVEKLTAEQGRLQKRLVEMEQRAKNGDPFAARQAEQLRSQLEGVTIKLGEYNQQLVEGEDGIRKSVVEQRKLGKSWEQIARDNDISTQKAKEYAKQAELIAKQTKKAEKGALDLTTQTESAAQRTKNLAGEWDKTSGAVQGSVDEMLKAVAFMILQQRQAAEKINYLDPFALFEEANRQAILEKTKDDLRAAIKNMKEMEKLLEDLKIEFGLAERKTTATVDGIEKIMLDFTESFRTARREIEKINNESAITEIVSPAAAILAKFDEESRLVDQQFQDQKDALIDQYDAAVKDLAQKIADKEKELKRKLTAKERAKFQLEVKLELEDGRVLVGKDALDTALAEINEQQRVTNLRLSEKAGEDLNKLTEEQRQQVRDRLKILTDGLNEERELLKERYNFEIEFADETTVSGLESLGEKRIRLLELERETELQGVIEALPAYKEADNAIVESLRARIAATNDLVFSGTLTEEEAIERIEKLEREALVERNQVRDRLYVQEREREGSRVFQIVRRYGDKEQQVIDEIDAKIRDLPKAYNPFLSATQSLIGNLQSAWQRYYDSLEQMRNADAEKAAEDRQRDIDDLKAQLRRGSIVYEDYIRGLANLREENTEGERSFAQEFGALLSEMGLETAKATQRQVQLSEDGSNAWAVLKESAGIATAAIITSTAGLALEGGKNIGDFALVMIDSVAAVLEGSIPALVALIFGKSVAENPLVGGLLAGALTAALYGLVALGKTALQRGKQKATGSKAEGGYAGDGGKYEEMGVYHGGEFIHTKEETAEHRELFEWIHGGKDPVDWFIAETGKVVGKKKAGIIGSIIEGRDPVQWIIEEYANLSLSRKPQALEVVQTIVAGADPVEAVLKAYWDEAGPLIERMRLSDLTVGEHGLNDSARYLTRPDGATINNRDVTQAIDRQTAQLSGEMRNLQSEFEKTQAVFEHRQALHLTGETKVSGGDLVTIFDKQREGALSS